MVLVCLEKNKQYKKQTNIIMFQRIHCKVMGRVQGVCFRAYTCQEAKKYHLTGWVKNNHDASVELVAEGDAVALQQLIAWLHVGPQMAKVETVDVLWETATGAYIDFKTAYGERM